jgi:DNA polymerase-3 subunit gamma/tau
MAWYNKYRPSNFAQTSGQSLVKRVLQNSVKTIFSPNPKVKHAYLLSGPRGTGKTSLARIFAKSVNCLDRDFIEKNGEACGVCDVCKNGQIDIIELDAASNTGIDNIRDLIEAANTPPFISRYKIYIIDEVHMLSKSAMNALLKTLE